MACNHDRKGSFFQPRRKITPNIRQKCKELFKIQMGIQHADSDLRSHTSLR